MVNKVTASMEAQRPEAADFTRPRLMLGPHYNWQGSKPNVLSSFTHSRSQVKFSEDKWMIHELIAGRQQQCKLHLQARALL